jgi:signal transduction histidine kinase
LTRERAESSAGKLGAWPGSVNLPADMSLSTDRTERRASDPRADALEALVLPLLRQQAEDLAQRWTDRARSALLLDHEDGRDAAQAGEARGLVEALIADFAGGDGVSEDTIGYGMRFGGTAFARGVSIHHVLKALDLLMAMTLFAMESALGEIDDAPGTTAADGVRLSRRLQRRGALLALAATRGYMHAYAEALRDRFRHLRHDLRNPLGTIKSVLALMDDDSVPLEARGNPSFRAMATRNAKSLEELIAVRLGDVAALLPSVAGQNVSVRAIVCAVRRELRTEAERRGVTISVEQGGPHGRIDAAGLELLLRELLHVTLHECDPGDQLHIGFDRSAGHVALAIARESGHAVPQDLRALERLSALAGQVGATITAGERTLITVPLRLGETAPTAELERSVSRDVDELSDREARHDVRGAREGHHGQTSAH